MVEDTKVQYKYIMFVRHDAMIRNELPIDKILLHPDKISIPNDNHWEGYNDRFAIMNYNNACIYGKRIGRILKKIMRNLHLKNMLNLLLINIKYI